jgi:Na+-transporting NADH:ubiquinone oxidoreductase subunit NqrB
MRATPGPRLPLDPRYYQIAVLSGLLLYGLGWLHFDITPARAALLLGAALLTQYACTILWRLPRFDAKSALISGLSLCLLCRTNDWYFAALAAVVTIASKFVLRWNGKHVFNPTNFGLVFLMLLGAPVWVSPGQWGNVAFFGFLMACLGGLVVNRAARSDVTYAFLLSFAALQFGRAAWMMQRWAVPIHRLERTLRSLK